MILRHIQPSQRDISRSRQCGGSMAWLVRSGAAAHTLLGYSMTKVDLQLDQHVDQLVYG